MIEILLVLTLLGAAYPIVVYPLLVLLVARLRPRPWVEGPYRGEIAHIITVHNEEARIRAKLENALALEASGLSVQTIVASDGSTDGTERVAREFGGHGILWLPCSRRGKEYAQLDALRLTKAPVLVFSDASTLLERAALPALLAPFRDPRVLAVSGTDVPLRTGEGTGEDLYVRFEMRVRRAESLAGTIVGLSGCFFAVRREIAQEWNPRIPSDFSSALLAIAAGGRAVAAEHARGSYLSTPSMGAEFARKRRTALRGLRCLWEYRRVLAGSDRRAAWQILSHKWWRFSVPLWLLLAGVVLILGAREGKPLWTFAVASTAAAFLVALLGLTLPRLRRSKPIASLAYALASAAAVVMAWKDFLVGRTEVRWTPTARPN